MKHVRVKPAREGESLSHPLDGLLPTEGGLWREDQFTFRRLRDGDLIKIDENGEPVRTPDADVAGGGTDAQTTGTVEPEAFRAPSPPARGRGGVPAQTTGPSAADTAKE